MVSLSTSNESSTATRAPPGHAAGFSDRPARTAFTTVIALSNVHCHPGFTPGFCCASAPGGDSVRATRAANATAVAEWGVAGRSIEESPVGALGRFYRASGGPPAPPTITDSSHAHRRHPYPVQPLGRTLEQAFRIPAIANHVGVDRSLIVMVQALAGEELEAQVLVAVDLRIRHPRRERRALRRERREQIGGGIETDLRE